MDTDQELSSSKRAQRRDEPKPLSSIRTSTYLKDDGDSFIARLSGLTSIPEVNDRGSKARETIMKATRRMSSSSPASVPAEMPGQATSASAPPASVPVEMPAQATSASAPPASALVEMPAQATSAPLSPASVPAEIPARATLALAMPTSSFSSAEATPSLINVALRGSAPRPVPKRVVSPSTKLLTIPERTSESRTSQTDILDSSHSDQLRSGGKNSSVLVTSDHDIDHLDSNVNDASSNNTRLIHSAPASSNRVLVKRYPASKGSSSSEGVLVSATDADTIQRNLSNTVTTFSDTNKGQGDHQETHNDAPLDPHGDSAYLPCELMSWGICERRFDIDDFDRWSEHIVSEHFRDQLPSKVSCWFCDTPAFRDVLDSVDRHSNFQNRLRHIWEHIHRHKVSIELAKIDPCVLEHMHQLAFIEDTAYLRIKNIIQDNQASDQGPSQPDVNRTSAMDVARDGGGTPSAHRPRVMTVDRRLYLTKGMQDFLICTVTERLRGHLYSFANDLEAQINQVPDGAHGSTSKSSDTPTTSGLPQSQSSKRQRGKYKDKDSGGASGGKDSEDGDSPKKRKVTKTGSRLTDEPAVLVCPYFAHDPSSCSEDPQCSKKSWNSFRLKEHITCKHLPRFECVRCLETFRLQKEYRAHQLSRNACSAIPRSNQERTVLEQLKDRKLTWRKTEVERWNIMFKIIFPNVALPSPYFADHRGKTDHIGVRDFADFIVEFMPTQLRPQLGSRQLRFQLENQVVDEYNVGRLHPDDWESIVDLVRQSFLRGKDQYCSNHEVPEAPATNDSHSQKRMETPVQGLVDEGAATFPAEYCVPQTFPMIGVPESFSDSLPTNPPDEDRGECHFDLDSAYWTDQRPQQNKEWSGNLNEIAPSSEHSWAVRDLEECHNPSVAG
ncbi:hypothetical protein F5Y15DRAFT_307899 [Xylariaceae sp. FL0016]|nr:hypothetical protein F5Y15DRAFT_307899 [Xylariaceae sp. FL0016]